MLRLLTANCSTIKLKFSYEISVGKDGLFATTLPKEVVDSMQKAGIKLARNRLNNYGYFEDNSLTGLKNQVQVDVEKYSKRELVSVKTVLLYSIETNCHYCKTKVGEIVPNGRWQQKEDGEYKWIEGSKGRSMMSAEPYGFFCYVEPKLLNTWKFPDGEYYKEYLSIPDGNKDKNLDWLNSVVHMGKTNYSEPKEIDYTPELGKFFKSIIIYVCQMNEKLKELFTEDIDLSKAKLESFQKLLEEK